MAGDLVGAGYYERDLMTSVEEMQLSAAAKCVRESVEDTLTYTYFPMRRWGWIRTNNAIE